MSVFGKSLSDCIESVQVLAKRKGEMINELRFTMLSLIVTQHATFIIIQNIKNMTTEHERKYTGDTSKEKR